MPRVTDNAMPCRCCGKTAVLTLHVKKGEEQVGPCLQCYAKERKAKKTPITTLTAIPYRSVTWRDYPEIVPCETCPEMSMCFKNCKKKHDFIFTRAEWVQQQNRTLEQKYGLNPKMKALLEESQ